MSLMPLPSVIVLQFPIKGHANFSAAENECSWDVQTMMNALNYFLAEFFESTSEFVATMQDFSSFDCHHCSEFVMGHDLDDPDSQPTLYTDLDYNIGAYYSSNENGGNTHVYMDVCYELYMHYEHWFKDVWNLCLTARDRGLRVKFRDMTFSGIDVVHLKIFYEPLPFVDNADMKTHLKGIYIY